MESPIVWVCGCVGVWVCGCVGVWVCGCVCGCVGVLVCVGVGVTHTHKHTLKLPLTPELEGGRMGEGDGEREGRLEAMEVRGMGVERESSLTRMGLKLHLPNTSLTHQHFFLPDLKVSNFFSGFPIREFVSNIIFR